jgi:hypothetical protein
VIGEVVGLRAALTATLPEALAPLADWPVDALYTKSAGSD